MKRRIKKILKSPSIRLRKVQPEVKMNEAIENLPRITNETAAAHREELLSGARKYIYPLEHTKHRIVTITTIILVAVLIFFFAYTGLGLYKFQSSSTFLYDVTQVIPFPIAKAGPSYVAYESYLFELRHYTHYYQAQQQIDFNSTAGKRQLALFKKQALQQVIDDAYVKQLAEKNHITINDQDVNNAVQFVRNQNRLGTSDQEFSDVLKNFWGWSVDDFKRELKLQLLAQKVISVLDTNTHDRASSALSKLQSGADFATLAQQYSDDVATKGNGGEYGYLIDKTNQDLSPQITVQLFSLSPGQISPIINTGYVLEIVKVISVDNGRVRAAHIVFNFKDISTYITQLQAKEHTHTYVSV